MSKVANLFLPGKPIKQREMLVGRTRQLNRIVQVLESGGRAVVITGARGIGKTSLANVAAALAGDQVETYCNARTSFNSWSLQLLSSLGQDLKVIEKTVEETLGASFAAKFIASIGVSGSNKTTVKEKGVSQIELTPDVLFPLLLRLGNNRTITVDEFDRIPRTDETTVELFGDLLKLLGNRSGSHDIKIVFVGVSSSAQRLFNGHPSIKRNVVPIHLARLSGISIKSYLSHITEITDYSFDSSVVDSFIKDFKGFPHFVHLVGSHCLAERPQGGLINMEIYEESVDCAIDEMLGINSAWDFIRNRPSLSVDLIIKTIVDHINMRPSTQDIQAVLAKADIGESEISQTLSNMLKNKLLRSGGEIVSLIDPEISPFLHANLRRRRYVSKEYKTLGPEPANQLSLNM